MHAALKALPDDVAGSRITDHPALGTLLTTHAPIGALAAEMLGPAARPVRAILFDKNPSTNWSLGWHQDRTICVRERRSVEGFGPWTSKQRIPHVEPPFALLSRMMTLRVHLDDVPHGNGPLLVAPGSHLLGRISESEVDRIVARCGIIECLAEAGDVWIYATPILHASKRSIVDGRRRVLQVDYSADALPGGLEWLGL